MFQIQRRVVPTSSDSSEDETPKQQIKILSSGYSQNILDIADNTLPHKSRKRQVERRRGNSTNSDSSSITNLRKRKRRVLSLNGDSSSSDDQGRLDTINLRISANSGAEVISGGGSGQSASSLNGRTNQIMNSATTSIQSCLRHIEREESDSSDVVGPKRVQRKHHVVSSDDSVSSDNEEIFHPARRGALRALSDYESGNSLDGGVGPTTGELRRRSDSSSDNDVIRILSNSRSKRHINPFVTSDSSDSGIPIGLNRIRKRMRIYSSEDSETNETNRRFGRTDSNTINESSRRPRRTVSNANEASRRVISSAQESARRPRRAVNNTNEASRRVISSPQESARRPRRTAVNTRSRMTISTRNESSRRIVNNANEANRRVLNSTYEPDRRPSMNTRSRTVISRTNESSRRIRRVNDTIRPTLSRVSSVRRSAYSTRGIRSNRNGVGEMSDSQSTDSDAIVRRPEFFRRYRALLDLLLDSSSDSSDNFRISNPIRFRNVPVIQESDEESVPTSQNRTLVDNKTTSTLNISVPNKTASDCSSDSDGESEKCPICLARFNSQEVGTPATCEHSFCATCILEWAKSNNTCPIDRQYFTSITVRAQLQGQVIREVPIQNSPTRTVWENGDWWERWEMHNTLAPLSDYDSDSDGPEEVCCVCYQSDDSDAMIVCDYCMRVYHMGCVNPPLTYVPANDWYCTICMELGVTSDSD